ncbi:MAG: peptide chain release factor 1 [Candidatus Dadabacteria bacterium]|nr:peptide chain release factor 1 [Candidatus Dadabacteria bacterium]NIV41268.1 peptide chain release factor 1 [Candidatus Dadabacteria bacterium]NIX15111.1 peptide chain release factor 1 [Candidatus Dadabacteria bacterium]
MSNIEIIKQLEEVEKKCSDLDRQLSNPEISPTDIHKFSSERSKLTEVVEAYREYKSVLEQIENNKELLKDKELQELAKEELEELEPRQQNLEKELQILLLPKDPNDEKSIFIEIRAGTGGEEAALFAANLFRMYTHFAEKNGWKVEIMNINDTGIGGIKEVVASIEGKNVYKKFKFESGVHRVQRVPATETGGRIHTSTATVMILVEPEDVEVDIDEKDLRVDTYRASGPGGQHVNKTDSAIRITHIPTGVVAQCQDERSQHKNRAKAMRMLKAKIFELEEEKRQSEISNIRKNMVGSGDRSEKIRTYNYKDVRVTDHRIGLTLHKLEQILEGELDELIDALNDYQQNESLKQSLQN